MPPHKEILADGVETPVGLTTDRFVIRELTVDVSELDFRAWMSSLDHLRGIFGPLSSWPRADMTLEQNNIDLAWHQSEFGSRSSFAYTVFDATNTVCVGCVYLYPPRKVGFDIDVYYWVSADEAARGGDQALGEVVRVWVIDEWPFANPVYPGRSLPWPEYLALPDREHW